MDSENLNQNPCQNDQNSNTKIQKTPCQNDQNSNTKIQKTPCQNDQNSKEEPPKKRGPGRPKGYRPNRQVPLIRLETLEERSTSQKTGKPLKKPLAADDKRHRRPPKGKLEQKDKLNKKVQEKICAHIRMGSYLSIASRACGITPMTLHNWLERGKKATELKLTDARSRKYVRFVKAVNKAIAEAEILDLKRIDLAAETIWQAAAWKLERKAKERWGRNTTHAHTHSGPEGGPILHQTQSVQVSIDSLDLPLEVRKQLLQSLRQKKQELLENPNSKVMPSVIDSTPEIQTQGGNPCPEN